MATDYYFHVETKLFCMILDDDVSVMWDDRNEDVDFINAYIPVHDFMNDRTLLVEHDDFHDDFFPVDDDFFNEIHLYDLGLDDLETKKLKLAFELAQESQNELK